MTHTLLVTTLLLVGQAPPAPSPFPAPTTEIEERDPAPLNQDEGSSEASDESSERGPNLVPIEEPARTSEEFLPADVEASAAEVQASQSDAVADETGTRESLWPSAQSGAAEETPRSVLLESEIRSTAETRPTTSEQPAASEHRAGGAATSRPPVAPADTRAALAGLLARPERQALAGEPLTLLEALPASGDRQKQIEVVQAYWETLLRASVYHAALADIERLTAVSPPQGTRETLVFEQALLSAEATAQQAELRAVDAQYALAEKAGLAIVDLLPLPAEEPFIGSYRTNYDSLFVGRAAPVRLRRIDRTLPLCQRLLEARAEALAAAEAAWEEEVAAHGRGEISLELLLASFDRLAAQRIAFLDLVRRYNFDIAEFALNVASAGTSRETIVAMLIESESGRATSPNQPATALEPLPGTSFPRVGEPSGAPATITPRDNNPRPINPRTFVLPGQPTAGVGPVRQPTAATPAAESTEPNVVIPSTIPSPAENAGPGAFREVSPRGGGEIRQAQALAPLETTGPRAPLQPAGASEPLRAVTPGRVVDSPPPPGLEGTRSVLVRRP